MNIFICYRSKESDGWARVFADRFCAEFPASAVFDFVDVVRPGTNIKGMVRQALARSSIMVVLIGPSWLDPDSTDGAIPLDDPNDMVGFAGAHERRRRCLRAKQAWHINAYICPHRSTVAKLRYGVQSREGLGWFDRG
jgi:hypothetical protein